MVGVEEVVEEVQVVQVVGLHELEGAQREEAIQQVARLLNFEWPRSEAMRVRGLASSSAELPCSLVLLVRGEVAGTARLSSLPAVPQGVFLESVVVHPGLRGLGLGKLLMVLVEGWCRAKLGATSFHLTTHDQQLFYSRCGYSFSQPVCAFGGSSKLNMSHMWGGICTRAPPPAPTPLNLVPGSGPAIKDTSSQPDAPAPPPPPGPPPPPPPGPPPPAVPRPTANTVCEPAPALLAACRAAFATPDPVTTAALATARLATLDRLPAMDLARAKARNTEDSGGKMFMMKAVT